MISLQLTVPLERNATSVDLQTDRGKPLPEGTNDQLNRAVGALRINSGNSQYKEANKMAVRVNPKPRCRNGPCGDQSVIVSRRFRSPA